MKRIMLLILIQSCFLVVFAQPGNNTGSESLYKTIDSLNRAMEKAFNTNDMAGTAAFYSDDAQIIASNYSVGGRKDLDNYWLSLKDRGRGWKLTVTEIGGNGEFLYQLGNSDLTYMVKGAETKSITNFVLIWKRQTDGSYKIFRDYLTGIEFKKK